MSTFSREAAFVLSLPKRADFAGEICKNRLVCKNAVALAYYGSCRLLGLLQPPKNRRSLCSNRHMRKQTVTGCQGWFSSFLSCLVSRNVFHVVSALQSIVCLYIFLLIRSLVDHTLAAFIVCSPLQFLVQFSFDVVFFFVL